jgi:DeoR family transcriptional regulator of aga operon
MAPHCVVLADSSKFGRVSTVYLAPVSAAHTIITDTQAPPLIVEELQELGLEIHLV